MNFSFSSRFFVVVFVFFVFLFTPLHLTLALTQEEQRAQWQVELQQTEAEIAKWQAVLNTTKQNTASLKRDADVLNAKIQEAKAFIKKRNIAIAQLTQEIDQKTATIETLEQKIQSGHQSLTQLLRQTDQIDRYSLPEIVLSGHNISDFFSDLDTFQTIKIALADQFAQIRTNQVLVEEEKATLDKKKNDQTDQKVAKQVEQNQIQKDEQQKQYLIQVNKTQEKTYAQVIAEQQAKASAIRAKLFNLAGGGSAIPFGTALSYAQTASAQTGVKASFLLAILTQESNLGANVGKCYLTDTTNGSGVNITTGKVWSNLMKAPRDTQPFLDITYRLGFDPLKTVVSCPIAGVGGYGGAMGPAQFIASTWHLFEDRLKTILDHDANPWNPQDAFMASALYLADLGASSGTYTGEMRAACKYYGTGGSNCSYGRSVQNIESGIQSDIDYLNQYGISRR